MTLILEYKGTKLIKKYDNYYIRFLGGQTSSVLCDLKISDEEASEIIENPEKIKLVRDSYKNKVDWAESYFVDSTLNDYLLYECNLNKNRINETINKLNKHEDIKNELYETIMYGEFPVSGAISVCNYIAEELNKNAKLSILGAYNFLIYLREDEENALADLEKGLPIK